MQTTSELYQQLLSSRDHVKQIRVAIEGVCYGENIVVSLSTSAELYKDNTPGVGNCISREIDLELLSPGKIPRMAEIRPEVRLVLGMQTSEWLPKGVFYIDTRQLDAQSGLLSIHGYDAMLKAEQTYLQDGDAGEWPRPMPDVVADIARRMGVSIDARTVINPAYMVGYPNDLTMREILGYIAAVHAGNWIITDAGELYLVPLYNPATDYANLGYLAAEDGSAITFGGVRILV